MPEPFHEVPEERPIQILADYESDNEIHGYSVTGDRTTFYWVIDSDGLRFRKSGYPVGHPVTPPTPVFTRTQEWARENYPERV